MLKRHISAVSFSDAEPADLPPVGRAIDFVGSHIFLAILASFEFFAATLTAIGRPMAGDVPAAADRRSARIRLVAPRDARTARDSAPLAFSTL
ncbi:hypothetical protein IY145_24060 [Methylosinus sp. H3A]|uniref:hypothetical protein n=1 Tax=Methylosinus sp. H3A TaxID=2785786 RepID=UPI0018C2647F|nr:hypothetical protein [Methylosinus sp. H3A]MBG0812414.1 hypothetical protein [Methylosinus sp. H3A]